LLPVDIAHWPVTIVDDFEEALEWADVVGLLRLQRERGSGSFVPSLGEFTRTFGLTVERARRLRPSAVIMHPGPMNRGVEIDSRVADLPSAVIERQVANAVAGSKEEVVL
jgi:aspartate carbamoyltransferase catalytic subunit